MDAVLHADVVTLRLGEQAGAERIVDAFLRGLGENAERILGGFLETAAGRLVRSVTSEHRRFFAKPDLRGPCERRPAQRAIQRRARICSRRAWRRASICRSTSEGG